MNVKISKSPIPICWLDTSVVIEMAKVQQGISNAGGNERYNEIYQILYQKVRDKKIICPRADQEEEIEDDFKACRAVQTYLSLGVRFKHRKGIQDLQMQKLMRAFADRSNDIHFSYEDAFFRDPIKTVEEARKSRFIISAESPPPGEEDIKTAKHSRLSLAEKTESLRIENTRDGVVFEEQLLREYTGHIQATVQLLKKLYYRADNGAALSTDEFLTIGDVVGFPLNIWGDLGGQPPGLEGLLSFYSSHHYKNVPYINIASILWADLLSGRSPVVPSDLMDIDQLSTVIPYCSFVITDNKVKNRIRRHNIGSLYQTEVWSMRDYELLRSAILSL